MKKIFRVWCIVTAFLWFISLASKVYPATYYVDPNTGNDGNSGTKASPWKTLAAKINTLLPGDILILRGGIYYERFTIIVSGAASNRITIRSYPGESPIIDGGSECKALRKAPNTLWTMYGTSTSTYVTTNTYPSGIGSAYGYLGPENGGYALNAYDRMVDLMSENQNATMGTATGTYCGPGLYYDTGTDKIYCRLVVSDIADTMNLRYPLSSDPRETSLFIFGDAETVKFGATASYINFEGIEVRYQLNAIEFTEGAHDINIRNCTIIGGRTPLLIRTTVYNILIENCKFIGRVPDWISWTDIKGKRSDQSQIAGNYQGAAAQLDGICHDIEVAYCYFENVFDGVNPIDAAYNVSVHDNTFMGVRDDCMQIGTECHDLTMYNNKIIACSKGFSTNWSGNAADADLGKIYVHHNIIDCTKKKLGGRAKNNDGVGFGDKLDFDTFGDEYAGPGVGNPPVYDGMVWARPFGDHSSEEGTTKCPWKVYNNTILFGRELSNYGAGLEYRFGTTTAGVYQEVYNNIIVQICDYRYMREWQINNTVSESIYDGNCYYNSFPGTRTDYAFRTLNGATSTDTNSLNGFLASGDFNATKSYYAPGWESSGVEGNPGLDSNYRPTTAFGMKGALDLTPKGWPGVDGGIYRGALRPK